MGDFQIGLFFCDMVFVYKTISTSMYGYGEKFISRLGNILTYLRGSETGGFQLFLK